jgi:WD40 repeat protein
VRFTPDGQYVISGSRDGVVSVWKITFGEKAALECIDSIVLSGKITDIGALFLSEGFFTASESGKDMEISRIEAGIV